MILGKNAKILLIIFDWHNSQSSEFFRHLVIRARCGRFCNWMGSWRGYWCS